MLKRLSLKRFVSIERSSDATFIRLKNVQVKFKRRSIEYTKVLSHSVNENPILVQKDQESKTAIKLSSIPLAALVSSKPLDVVSPTPQDTRTYSTCSKAIAIDKPSFHMESSRNISPQLSTVDNKPLHVLQQNPWMTVGKISTNKNSSDYPLAISLSDSKHPESNKLSLVNLWDENYQDSLEPDFSQFNLKGMRPSVLEYLRHARNRDPNLF